MSEITNRPDSTAEADEAPPLLITVTRRGGLYGGPGAKKGPASSSPFYTTVSANAS